MTAMKFFYRFTPVVLLVFFCTLISLPSKAQSSRECGPGEFGHNPHTGQFYLIRGISLYVEEYGKGEPLVLLHGNGGSIASFACQIPYFEKKYHVIAIDSRAQGNSADDSDSLTFEMMADDVSELLNNLRLDSCNVFGWSDGGITGLILAMRHPDKVKSLAITGANLKPDSSSLTVDGISGMQDDFDRLSNMEQTREVKNNRKLVGLDLFEPSLTATDLKEIHCPTLVIGGDHDLIPVSHTVLIAQSIPNAFLWILPNSGHGTLIEYHEEVNHTIDRFFNGQLHP